jgi:hypothetical protein
VQRHLLRYPLILTNVQPEQSREDMSPPSKPEKAKHLDTKQWEQPSRQLLALRK